MVPLTGLEPVQYRYRGILSPLCLPIPPQRRLFLIIAQFFATVKSIEGKSEVCRANSLCQRAIHGKGLPADHMETGSGFVAQLFQIAAIFLAECHKESVAPIKIRQRILKHQLRPLLYYGVFRQE